MMRREDYLPIQAWMRGIGLTDKQLLIYALIYSYSRDGRSCWRGTAKHLAEWADCSVRNAQKIVRQLEDMGLVGHDVVAWSNGRKGGVRSEFWAFLPEHIAQHDPEARKASRTRINWAGRGRGLTNRSSQGGYVPEFVTPYNGIKVFKDISCGGGKYNARSRAKDTTTTTGFLFENNGAGLAPGEAPKLQLPWKGKPFVEAWEMLLQQPKWREKTPEALQVQLNLLALTEDPDGATHVVRLAISKGWDWIKDPAGTISQDYDSVLRYPKSVWEDADDE